MKLAKILDSNDIIEAEDLRFIAKNDMPKFVCPDMNCNTPLIAAAYTEDSKQRPHFRTLKNHKHSEKCQFSDYAKILELGGKRKLLLAEFEYLPIPTKLVPPKAKNESDKIKSTISNEIDEKRTATKRGVLDSFDEGGNNFRNVTTISRIVDFYIACPFNRDIKLDIFGSEKEYMYWFKRIRNIQGDIIPDSKIFFGQLHQDRNAIEEKDSEINLRLYDCQAWDEERNQINPFFVSIPTTNLSKNKIARIKNEINFALQEQKNYYKNSASSENVENEEQAKSKPYIFFLGKQNPTNRLQLLVQDGYLVSRYAQIRKTVMD
jgi:hypothetical protein